MTALRLRAVDVTFGAQRARRRDVAALRSASLAVDPGERVALVGRSGAGKSTVARLAVGLVRPNAGSVEVLGTDISSLSRRELRSLRRRLQLVFQDPYESLTSSRPAAANTIMYSGCFHRDWKTLSRYCTSNTASTGYGIELPRAGISSR